MRQFGDHDDRDCWTSITVCITISHPPHTQMGTSHVAATARTRHRATRAGLEYPTWKPDQARALELAPHFAPGQRPRHRHLTACLDNSVDGHVDSRVASTEAQAHPRPSLEGSLHLLLQMNEIRLKHYHYPILSGVAELTVK